MPKKTQRIFLLALALSLPVSLWASKRILVDLTHQIAIAYEDGQVKFYGRVSSGRPGMETPTGSFRIREKELKHVSNLWPKPNGGATMPYMMRITRDGVALHLDPAPDYPASHGCIRLRDGFAQRMYAWAPKWTRVDVIGKAPAHSPAVSLPAYATSERFLRRSIGGGNGSPLMVLSSNPKDHRRPNMSILPQTSSPQTFSHADTSTHANPLAVLSGNPKHPKSYVKSSTPTSQGKPQKRKRKHNRHPSPLGAISGR